MRVIYSRMHSQGTLKLTLKEASWTVPGTMSLLIKNLNHPKYPLLDKRKVKHARDGLRSEDMMTGRLDKNDSIITTEVKET